MTLIPLRGVPSASLSPCTQPVAAFAKEGAAHVSTQECGVRKAGLGRLVGVQGEHREGKEVGVRTRALSLRVWRRPEQSWETDACSGRGFT